MCDNKPHRDAEKKARESMSFHADAPRIRILAIAYLIKVTGRVHVLAETHLHDTVVIDPQRFAQRVLGNLQASIDIPSQDRDKVKTKIERESETWEGLNQGGSRPPSSEQIEYFLTDMALKAAAGGGQHAASLYGRVLVVNARRKGERQRQGKGIGSLF